MYGKQMSNSCLILPPYFRFSLETYPCYPYKQTQAKNTTTPSNTMINLIFFSAAPVCYGVTLLHMNLRVPEHNIHVRHTGLLELWNASKTSVTSGPRDLWTPALRHSMTCSFACLENEIRQYVCDVCWYDKVRSKAKTLSIMVL